MNNFKIVPSQFLYLPCLSMIQDLCYRQGLKDIVISIDNHTLVGII
jgi:hypothetical protein